MIIERKAKIKIDEFEFNKEMLNYSEKDIKKIFYLMAETQQIYGAAVKEVSTKLEILDDEFHLKHSHNPIHHMEYRIKAPNSIMKKLKKKGIDADFSMASKYLNDIAGIRVICYYIEDVYKIAELLIKQDDIELVKKVDYIENPKNNGYSSLHLVVSVPVFLSNKKKIVNVEVQIRTIAMDFWASLEHELKYKSDFEFKDELKKELKECATNISKVDLKMMEIFKKISKENYKNNNE